MHGLTPPPSPQQSQPRNPPRTSILAVPGGELAPLLKDGSRRSSARASPKLPHMSGPLLPPPVSLGRSRSPLFDAAALAAQLGPNDSIDSLRGACVGRAPRPERDAVREQVGETGVGPGIDASGHRQQNHR
eukprot:gene6660-65189_t